MVGRVLCLHDLSLFFLSKVILSSKLQTMQVMALRGPLHDPPSRAMLNPHQLNQATISQSHNRLVIVAAPATAPAGYGKTVSPQPGYPQYDSTQVYAAPR
ncbi:hypothetical protein OIU76_023701 [Salix suchowensis]|nr:hypothetical protein OIU76_023701 [Salix suchowensis]